MSQAWLAGMLKNQRNKFRIENSGQKVNNLIGGLVADQAGEIFELDGYAAVGMEGPILESLSVNQTRNIP